MEMRLSSRLALCILVLLLAFPAGCGDDGTEPCVPVSVTVSPSEATLEIGETAQLSATSRDENGAACGSVNWSSSNTAVATCSGNGLVTGVTPGTATISATAGNQTGTATITVLAPCAFTCDCGETSCSLDISCESGSTSTTFTNESTSYEYDASGRRVKITLTLSRSVTYLNSGNTYTYSGTVVWDLVQDTVTWNIQVVGGAFGETAQTCSGSKGF
jgi:YD repeat-containing protein